MKRKYVLLQRWGLNVDVHLVSWLIQRKCGYPFHLKNVSISDILGIWVDRLCPWKSMHSSHWLPSDAFFRAQSWTLYHILFSFQPSLQKAWRLIVVYLHLLFPMFSECTLPGVHISAKKKKIWSEIKHSIILCVKIFKTSESEFTGGKIQCTQETIYTTT